MYLDKSILCLSIFVAVEIEVDIDQANVSMSSYQSV